eukprot:8774976-Pyramimonas_sp.AAC.1
MAFVGFSWGPCEGLLDLFLAHLGLVWAVLGPSGPSRGSLGGLWGRLGAIPENFLAVLDVVKTTRTANVLKLH